MPATPSVVDEAVYERAEQILTAAGYAARLKLLVRLLDGSRSVGELARLAGTDVSLVSKQLRILRLADLVTMSRDGRQVQCRIADDEARRFAEFVLSHAAGRVARTRRVR
ncbi:MAG TPA: metalloregulator ArsR/SmtB family transcription factor [Acidimicrobiales bacterium]